MNKLLARINYKELNAKQQESYNFQKVSAILADYGFITLKLSDDWQGTDFIAQHIDGNTFLKVQLKSRLSFAKKYEGKDLFIAFSDDKNWYLYPHDEVLKKFLEDKNIANTKSWQVDGAYNYPSLDNYAKELLGTYQI